MSIYRCECCDSMKDGDYHPPDDDMWCEDCATNHCKKCKGNDLEDRVVNEVGDMAVGPYTIWECADCGYEFVEH
jgi:hypothetical protein